MAAADHDAAIEDTSLHTWQQVLELNLQSCFVMARAASPHLRQGGGKVINIASIGCAGWPRGVSLGSHRTEREVSVGDGAHRWLAEAAACGTARIRSKMARAVELAAVAGTEKVDAALGLAAIAGRFADGDLPSIIDHLAAEREIGEVVRTDEAHSVQPGTSSWARLGTEGRR